MVVITIVNGVYKPTYNWGAPHCIYIYIYIYVCVCYIYHKPISYWSYLSHQLSELWGTTNRTNRFFRKLPGWKVNEGHLEMVGFSLRLLNGLV